MRTILVVEDETPIREMICLILEQNNYAVKQAIDFEQGINALVEPYPDLILIDWMLPKGSGIQLIKHIKKNPALVDIPIVMLSARSTEDDRVTGLNVGADDYIAKPFSPKELIARINAIFRRLSPVKQDDTIESHGLVLNLSSHRTTANGVALDLSPIEFKLLQFLMKNPERVYSRQQLLDFVWGTDVYVEDRTVDVVIRRLRKILQPSSFDQRIQTVRSAGYRFSIHD